MFQVFPTAPGMESSKKTDAVALRMAVGFRGLLGIIPKQT
jgi:hypothetical protein